MPYLLMGFGFIVLFFGCSSSTNLDSGTAEVDKNFELVHHLTNNMMQPRLMDFASQTQILEQKVKAACSGDTPPVTVEELQLHWHQMMGDFHYTQPFIYGPLLVEEEGKFGDTNPIQDVIYSLQDSRKQAVLIDKEISKSNLQKDKYKLRNTPNLIGLDALEYLLFAKLAGQTELAQDDESCRYFISLNAHLLEWVLKVTDSFQKRVYEPLQTSAGQTESPFYLDGYTKSMLHFADKTLKDRKLAAPLGIQTTEAFNCIQGVDCHLLFIEHSFSKTPNLAILSSLQSLQDAFQGTVLGEPVGFGYSDFIQDSTGQLKAFSEGTFIKRWKAMPTGDDYVAAFATYKGDKDTNNPAYAAYLEVKQLTTWLKTDFVADMNAELPKNVQGDTD